VARLRPPVSAGPCRPECRAGCRPGLKSPENLCAPLPPRSDSACPTPSSRSATCRWAGRRGRRSRSPA